MLWSAFILGLAGSFHCVGMCGPIALVIPTRKGKHKIFSLTLYHLGKLITYLIIGSLFGLIVASIYTFNIQAIITIISGSILILFAFIPQILIRIEKNGFNLFNGLIQFKNKLSRALNKERIEYSFYIGFLNGFIPCAMVYSAAIVALSQKTFSNSLIFMVFFGLGTIPLLTVFYFIAHHLKAKLAKHAHTFRTISFLIVGFFLIFRGIYFYNQNIPTPKEGGNFELCLPF